VERSVSLEKFPTGVEFPADLSLRIRYDPVRHRLVHIGFMSKIEFDRLWTVSDDWGYRRALEELFRLCTDEEEPRSGIFRRVRSVLGLF
jgi:hypothetical protein